METEKRLAEYATRTPYEALPAETTGFVRNLILGIVGTTIAGATQTDTRTMVRMVRQWGEKDEATILMYGGKAPACNAAFVNSIMARALDYEDGMPPGVHYTASIVPTALAASELAGGCSGKEFLTAVTVGSEVTAKLNACSFYDGFDPTGIVSVFGATAAAGRIMGLDEAQMLHALALAFNRAGGSFQCNIDGALAVTAIQGFVSQNAIICCQLAQNGVTGPVNFIEGIYGYLHLYGKDRFSPKDVTGDLGKTFLLHGTLCKKYPSCGCTVSATHAALELAREHGFAADEVSRVEVRQAPYCHKLVGHRFKIGDNPRVDAQFNVQYCVANAIVRGSSRLTHFEEASVREPRIMEMTERITVVPDADLGGSQECSLASAVEVITKKGDVYRKVVMAAPGLPQNSLTDEEHVVHFRDCVQYIGDILPGGRAEAILSLVRGLVDVEDVLVLIPLMVCEGLKDAVGAAGAVRE